MSPKESPVPVSLSFAIVPRSPECNRFTGICSFPRITCKVPIRSSVFLVWFCIRVSDSRIPDMTLRYVNFPTNGSAVVLNASTLHVSVSFSCVLSAVGLGFSAGEGR